MMSKKFKLVTVLFISTVLLIAPIGLMFLPSWDSKLTPMLNLMDTLLAEGGEERIGLGDFAFIGKDESSLTLRLDLVINNTDGPAMLFPAVNLSFNYGASHLGKGWIPEEVFIPANSNDTIIQVYARMLKGDAFNQFFMSLIGGGLSLSVSAGEAFIFLETFGGMPMGCLSIPLPSIPLPSIELESAAYPPSCHGITRGDVDPLTPIAITANVSDRGGGVREVILSWDNGSGWVNTTMGPLPTKDLMGGLDNFFGLIFNALFPSYPNNTIPTSLAPVVVAANIPGQTIGTEVQYRIHVIDVYNHSIVAPTTLPTVESGTADDIDLVNQYFNFTVQAGTISMYNASWLPTGGAAEPDMMTDMLDSLSASGVELMDLLFAGSELLASFSDLKIDLGDIEGSLAGLFDLFIPLIAYLDSAGVDPFEMLDQLLGFSGGMPGLPEAIQGPKDINYSINANDSVGLDILLESGLGLLDLMQFLAVNMSAMIEALGDSLMIPIAEMPDQTPAEALFILLNETRNNATKLAAFISFIAGYDAFFTDFPLLLYKYNSTDQAVIDVSENIQLTGEVDDSFYVGSPLTEGLLAGEYSMSNFTMININMSSNVNNFVTGSTYLWEYYNGSEWFPITQWEYFNGTHWVANATEVSKIANFTQSGRIKFDLVESMGPLLFAMNDTYWIRVNISAAGVTTPIANSITNSRDIMEYYYNTHHVDLLNRAYETITPGETDSIFNMIFAANATNGLTMKLFSILGISGVTYEDILDIFEVTTYTPPPPITGSQIIEASLIPMAFIVYSFVLFVVACSFRGRKGAYSISKIRVKKWYESNLKAPGMKGREELDHIKRTYEER